MSQGLLNDVTFQNGGELVVVVPGVYDVGYHLCFTDGVNTEYEIGITVNGVLQTKLASCGKKSNFNDVMSVRSSGFVDWDEGDIVRLVVINRTSATDIIVMHTDLNIKRIW